MKVILKSVITAKVKQDAESRKGTNSPVSFPSWKGTVVRALKDQHRCGVISSVSYFVEEVPNKKPCQFSGPWNWGRGEGGRLGVKSRAIPR